MMHGVRPRTFTMHPASPLRISTRGDLWYCGDAWSAGQPVLVRACLEGRGWQMERGWGYLITAGRLRSSRHVTFPPWGCRGGDQSLLRRQYVLCPHCALIVASELLCSVVYWCRTCAVVCRVVSSPINMWWSSERKTVKHQAPAAKVRRCLLRGNLVRQQVYQPDIVVLLCSDA